MWHKLQAFGRPVDSRPYEVPFRGGRCKDQCSRCCDCEWRAVLVSAHVLLDQSRRTLDAPGFRVPLTALAEGERGTWTLTIAAPGASGDEYTVSRRLVEVLHQDGEYAYVRGPLTPGEWYLPQGLQRLVPGQLVAVTNSDTLSVARSNERP